MAIIIATSSQSSFSGAVKHALACIGNIDLVRVRGSVQWQRLDCFIILWFPTGYGKNPTAAIHVDFRRGSTEAQVQDTEQCCVLNCIHLCSFMVFSS